MTAAAALRWLKKSSLWTYRTLVWAMVAVTFVAGTVVLGLRYWLLPNIDHFREDIARVVSNASRQHIAIGKISGNWDGLRPRLVLENVTVYDRSDRPALELARVDSTLSWRSLAIMRVSFHALDIFRPALDVRRDPQGGVWVAGIALDPAGGEDGGFADWLLDQPDIEVHDAALEWTDELRGAPPLSLKHVHLQLVNRGRRHRFGLQAEAPSEIARGLDIRGDLRGRRLDALSEWNGRLFVQLDHVDIAAWRAWMPFPIEFPQGSGALRTWLTFDHDELTQAIADVRLAGVRTRLREDLPELELDTLSGRFGWKSLPQGYEISTTRLSLATSRLGIALQPADALLRVTNDKAGNPVAGELHANALDLAPLVMLADRLPLDESLRKRVAAAQPAGMVHDLSLRWKGTWPKPQSYGAHVRFAGLGFKRLEHVPGVSGVSGTVDATEKGGALLATVERGSLDLPEVFHEVIPLDTASGQLAWVFGKDGLDLRFHNVAAANADFAGVAAGSYHLRESGGDEMDISGNLTRADARATARYLPVGLLGKEQRPWFERAFVAGSSSDVRFRVKGRSADFPYPDNKGGIFSISAKVTGGILHYADGWPRIERIDGELQFRGQRMAILATQAGVYGAKLVKVRANIPNLDARAPVLTVSGDAEGPTADFLEFIAKSPVNDMLDKFTEEARAQGRGRLALKLVLPLANLRETRVNGSYTFVNNNIVIDSAVPPIDQTNGKLEFTESSVRVPSATGIFLGGPVTLNANTQRDGVIRIGMTGRINADNVRKLGSEMTLMQHLRGATDWRGSFIVRRKTADLVVESTLQGMASDLPPPFSKAAAETVPLHFERRLSGGQERVGFSYGSVASGQFVMRSEGKRTVIDRGVVRFGGGPAGEPDKPGVRLSGAIKLLDFDEWLNFAGEGEGATSYMVSGMDLKIAQMSVLGRRLHDLAIAATAAGGAMQITATAQELEGSGTWRPQGKGRLTARLKRLVVPAAETQITELREKPAAPAKPLELPALDIVAESFQLGQKQLGRLELNAVHENRDWRIERLRITNPDSTLAAEGVWQAWLSQPRTQINLRFDVNDIGKTLTRWGFPEGVRRGTAKIEGTLHWTGSPREFDYPTLGGNLVIDAARGQFVKLEPGIAKLLGILSLQALPRRITLDFRDIFSEGFAFDAILGAVTISRGVASADNLRIAGPSAQIVMSGVVDLARETQSLFVRVSPHLSDSVSIAGALIGGPVAGVAAFLAQKLLKDPLDQIAGFDYGITGTWSDPQVAKLEHSEAAKRESTP